MDVYRLLLVSAAKRQTVRDRIAALQTPEDPRDWAAIAGAMFRAGRTDSPTNPVALSYVCTGFIEEEIAAIFPPGDADFIYCLDVMPPEGANMWLRSLGHYPVYVEP